MIPGSNILNMALRVIARQTFLYYTFLSRTPNVNGDLVASYNPGISLTGSVQPVPRDKYVEYGLDFQKNYITLYISKDVIDIERDKSGDQVLYAGKRYNAISRVPWFNADGWVGVLCVQIEDAG